MTSDDPIRTRLDALLQEVREQQDRALSALADGVLESMHARLDELRASVEADVERQTQARVEAVQSGATSRIAQAEADASARVEATRAELSAEIERVRAALTASEDRSRTSDAELQRGRAATAAEFERMREESESRAASAEARLAAAESRASDAQSRAADAESRARAVEHDRDARIAELEAAKSQAMAAASAHEHEAEAPLDRLLDSIRALDAARTLSEVLDALTVQAAREAARVAVVLIKGDRLRGWRTAGFDAAGLRDASAIDLDARASGILTQAARTGRRASTSDRAAADAAAGAVAPPPFATLPPDRAAIAIPVIVGGHVVAVLYTDEGSDGSIRLSRGWADAVELLARHTGRCLEALTAARTVAAAALARGQKPAAPADAEPSADEAAKRYAKLLVSEIKLYHQPVVEAGRRMRDIGERLGAEIARARRLYEERIGPDLRARTDYFEQELVRTLADGDPTLLGALRSSPAS